MSESLGHVHSRTDPHRSTEAPRRRTSSAESGPTVSFGFPGVTPSVSIFHVLAGTYQIMGFRLQGKKHCVIRWDGNETPASPVLGLFEMAPDTARVPP